MSWLMRTGTGRNNIAWGGGNTTSGQYLKRTANGRNNISYVSISSNGTHNLLERYNTTRNGIRWNNLSFSFFSFSDYALYNTYSIYIGIGRGQAKQKRYAFVSYLSDGYQVKFEDEWNEYDDQFQDGILYYVSVMFSKASGLADKFINAFNARGYTKVKLTAGSSSGTFDILQAIAAKIWTKTKQGVFVTDRLSTFDSWVEDHYSGITKIQFL